MGALERADSRRPVWLFSLDVEQFAFLPLVTGSLKAWFEHYGSTASSTDLALVHCRYHTDVLRWMRNDWRQRERDRARAAVARGQRPVAAFSCYTWNVPTFLDTIREMKRDCPELLVVAGGPHVQDLGTYLPDTAIDFIVVGEGEVTFTEMLDAPDVASIRKVSGVAFWDGDAGIVRTPNRPRIRDLDLIPSVIPHIPFAHADGRPYKWVAYETMRGCPFRCSYCQWGTGAIGVNITRFSLDRVREDLTAIMEGGVEGVLFCDSNFGALSDDYEKASVLVELNERIQRPVHFATCWSKNHNQRVRRIAGLLHKHTLLEHYTMALQTLTPRALALSNRMNMTHYRESARAMIDDGIPVVSELIWGLPGETLEQFEANLDELTTVFPSHTIYPYAMLPGTDLYDRREELEIETVALAAYGEASAEYIISCLSFDREEGMQGYALITSYILLYRGNLLPLTIRYLALRKAGSVSRALRNAFHELLAVFRRSSPVLDNADLAEVFEKREFIYRWLLAEPDRVFDIVGTSLLDQLAAEGHSTEIPRVERLLRLERQLFPRGNDFTTEDLELDFDAIAVVEALERMELPSEESLGERERRRVPLAHGWDFGDEMVPRVRPTPAGTLQGRYPIWP